MTLRVGLRGHIRDQGAVSTDWLLIVFSVMNYYKIAAKWYTLRLYMWPKSSKRLRQWVKLSSAPSCCWLFLSDLREWSTSADGWDARWMTSSEYLTHFWCSSLNCFATFSRINPPVLDLGGLPASNGRWRQNKTSYFQEEKSIPTSNPRVTCKA